MTMFEAALQNLGAYPRWLVATCALIVAAAGAWILVRVLKLALYLAVLVAFGCVAVAVLVWWWA